MKKKIQINNTNIYFEYTNALPMIDIQINFRAGSAFDNGKCGLADLAVGVFATQTKKSSELELINKITDISASIHAEASKEYIAIKIRLLNDSEIISKLTEILKEIFAALDFSETILAREKTQTMTHISYIQQQPGYIASLEFSKHLFQDNPYSNPTVGYQETVSDITVEDIKDFYNSYICANNANICVVGNIDETGVKNFCSEILSAMPAGTKNTQTFSQKKNDTNIITKEFNSTQTSILMGHQLLLEIDDKDYFPLKLGNEVLGGSGLNSLLFNEVREKLGLVYNIGSSINLNPDYGSFVISAQTSDAKLALDTINKIYNDFITTRIDSNTLQNTKNNIEGTHLISTVKNSSKLSMLSSIANKDLPLDFFDTYVENINKVTSQCILEAFMRSSSNNMLTIMVGGTK